MSGILDKLRDWVVPGLAVAGFADSAYLTALHISGEIPPCGGYAGCASVNTSPYAEIFGIPVAAFGTGAYALMAGISLWRTRATGHSWNRATSVLYGLALASSVFMVYLTGVEAFVIHGYCLWCLGQTAITLVLLGLVTQELLASGNKGADRLTAVPVRHYLAKNNIKSEAAPAAQQ